MAKQKTTLLTALVATVVTFLLLGFFVFGWDGRAALTALGGGVAVYLGGLWDSYRENKRRQQQGG
jgi:hypothetical protein